jgi:hypothetical protein
VKIDNFSFGPVTLFLTNRAKITNVLLRRVAYRFSLLKSRPQCTQVVNHKGVRIPHLSNTSNVDIADAYNLPLASVNLASANAALRPNESTRPSARKSPVSLVIGL